MNSQFLPLSYEPATAIRLLAPKLQSFQIGKRKVSVETQLRVLDKIHSLSKPNCYAPVKKIAEYVFCDERTARAAINALVEQCLLRESESGVGRKVIRRVDFDTIRQILSGDLVAFDESTNRAECPLPSGQIARHEPGRLPAMNRADCPLTTGQSARQPIDRVLPPPTAKGGGGWDDVLNRLKARSVARASEAIDEAQEAGHTVEEVDRLIRHFDAQQNEHNPPGAGLLVAWLRGSQRWPIINDSQPDRPRRQLTMDERMRNEMMAKRRELQRDGITGEPFKKAMQEIQERYQMAGNAIS